MEGNLGLFTSKKGPFVNPSLGDLRAQELLGPVSRGELRGLAELLATLRKDRWDDRGFYLTVLGDKVPVEAASRWVDQEPDNPDAHLLFGTRMLNYAFEARGADRAHLVSEKSWEVFHERVAVSQESLVKAAELLPQDPTPFDGLMSIRMSAGGDLETSEALYSAAMERDPANYFCHTRYGYLLCEKWLGSHEMMFDFARRLLRDVGGGLDRAAVMFRAHIERWYHYAAFDNRNDLALEYLDSREVVEETNAAFDRTMAARGYRPRKSSPFAWNLAAGWFYIRDDRPRLKYAMEQIGDAYRDLPWVYLGDAEEIIKHARKKAKIK
jgi:hypothetical protein